MSTIRLASGVVVAALLAVAGSPRAASLDRLVQLSDAFVDVDHASARWTIGNDTITYSIRLARDGTLVHDGLAIGGSDDVITHGEAPDALATIGGATVRLGTPGSTFEVQRIDTAEGSHFVSMSVRLFSDTHGVVATRHYLVYPQAAAVEMWTEFETADGDTRTIQNLNAYALTIPQGTVDWVSGLDTALEDGGPFTRRSRSLEDGETLDLGSPTLSSETAVPYFSVGNGHRRFLSGLIWSGGWTARLLRRGGELQVEVGLPVMSAWATADRSVEGPHAFVGVVLDQPGADIAAVTRFVHASRAGRELPALTTFNTWFVHGTHMDETTIEHDLDLASSIGVELLQIDAGWYPGSNPDDPFDFTRGLGSWTADPDRFPSGLGHLGAYAHDRGMKLGVWVEPERVDLTTVGREGLAEERFLATRDGLYSPGVPNDEARDGQICLADPGRARLGAGPAHAIDRRGRGGQHQVGLQPLAPLHAGGPWPPGRRRQLRAHARALRDPRGASPTLPVALDRELLGRGPSHRLRDGAAHRRGVDGRSQRARAARAAQPRWSGVGVSCALPLLLRDGASRRTDSRRPGHSLARAQRACRASSGSQRISRCWASAI